MSDRIILSPQHEKIKSNICTKIFPKTDDVQQCLSLFICQEMKRTNSYFQSFYDKMMKENYGYIIVNSAYMAVLPGLAIMVMVLAFNLVGNGLRDAFDTKESVIGRK